MSDCILRKETINGNPISTVYFGEEHESGIMRWLTENGFKWNFKIRKWTHSKDVTLVYKLLINAGYSVDWDGKIEDHLPADALMIILSDRSEETYVIKQDQRGVITCTCIGYRFHGYCKHITRYKDGWYDEHPEKVVKNGRSS